MRTRASRLRPAPPSQASKKNRRPAPHAPRGEPDQPGHRPRPAHRIAAGGRRARRDAVRPAAGGAPEAGAGSGRGRGTRVRAACVGPEPRMYATVQAPRPRRAATRTGNLNWVAVRGGAHTAPPSPRGTAGPPAAQSQQRRPSDHFPRPVDALIWRVCLSAAEAGLSGCPGPLRVSPAPRSEARRRLDMFHSRPAVTGALNQTDSESIVRWQCARHLHQNPDRQPPLPRRASELEEPQRRSTADDGLTRKSETPSPTGP